MIDYKTEVVVNRPVEDVFRLVKDVPRLDEWTDMSGTHLVSAGDLHLGSQIETTIKMGPSKQTVTFEVVSFEPNRRLGWKTTSKGSLQWDSDFLFEPINDGATRVISSGVIRLSGALKLLEGMMASEVRSGEAKELIRFKELAEKD
jgi:uncharacterized membrane protein